MGIFKKLGWYFKQEYRRYLLGVTFLILVAIVQIVPPKVIGTLVDLMDTKQLTATKLVMWLIILLAAAILQYVFRYGWRTRIWGGAAKLERTLRSRLFWHFMKMDTTFFQKHRTGDLMAHATNDLTAIQQVAGAGILTFADSIITGGTTIIAMVIFVDWRLTLMALIPMPLLAVVSRRLGAHLHTAFGQSQAAFSRLNDKTQESVSGIKVLKTFGQEAADIDDFNVIVTKTVKINKRVNLIDGLFDPSISLIIGLTYIVTIIYGGTLVMNHSISIGQLISFISYIAALVWPMFAIGRLFNVLERGNASYDRVEELLQETSTIIETPDALQIPATGDINYAIQKFTYPGDQQPTLANVSFTLQQGKTLGIVGKVGSGKTTLIKLLLREYDQYQGKIEINRHDIRDYSLDALLDSIGYVPQDNFLFSTDVRDNIRFADFERDQAAVEAAATSSAVHDDILRFAQGYETVVGERGVSLSGGQKQRIAIARAIMTDPEILILDDSLSAVDAKTEEAILMNLKTLRANQTTIITANRLSSVMHADEIIVMDNGQIAERGTHEALLAADGWYAKMWWKQQLNQALGGV
ncbi:ABC transporter ATP-binding protein [Latilactobacillus graminis]|uniref:ABC transporter transmembrane region family protein n=2 Tax=Latilactobacillus graminis TaxID=60519 RepID=A0AA89I286_9LACO|nr:ABC transporter transmembrane domain-containing protein [Latilactobacillus graminis]KRM22479.1 ABC transporter transmembrane region family protein [Latilactobacillus graminis DSM 20719]QFP79355.1 ATP-binding cassette domain-containing protein [Latilactobacillus graminis]